MSDEGRPPREPVTYGEWICLEWYDGPLSEIALVTFDDGEQYVEMRTIGGWVGDNFRVGKDGEKHHDNHMLFSREELVAMLDLLDGKPVPDWRDR